MQVDGVETHFGRGEFRVQCIAPDVRYTVSHTEKKSFYIVNWVVDSINVYRI